MQAEALLSDMAFERKIAEQKVRGREETINEHLVKLLAFDADEDLRASWKKELARKHQHLHFAAMPSSTGHYICPRPGPTIRPAWPPPMSRPGPPSRPSPALLR